tara:strand:- start:14065 stop:14715 length:651 start_codon:yes stop_codon:yes gene_type:complete
MISSIHKISFLAFLIIALSSCGQKEKRVNNIAQPKIEVKKAREFTFKDNYTITYNDNEYKYLAGLINAAIGQMPDSSHVNCVLEYYSNKYTFVEAKPIITDAKTQNLEKNDKINKMGEFLKVIGDCGGPEIKKKLNKNLESKYTVDNKTFMKSMKKGLLSTENGKLMVDLVDIDKYCECVTNKVFKRFDMSKFNTEMTQSKEYQEMLLECFDKHKY